MKQGNIVQLVIVIIALCIATNSIQYLVNGLFGLLHVLGSMDYGGGSLSTPLYYLFHAFLQLALCWILIIKSSPLAQWLYQRAALSRSISIIAHPADLLFVLLIVLGLYWLLVHLPKLLESTWLLFQQKAVSFGATTGETPATWASMLLKVLLPSLLLMFAKPISLYFATHVSDASLGIEDDPEYIETGTTNQE